MLLITRFHSQFFISLKTPENLTTLHSFVALKCHLLSRVTRCGQISPFPYWHLLSRSQWSSLKPTSFGCSVSPSTLFFSFLTFSSTHLKCFLGTHLSFYKGKDSLWLLLSLSLKREEIQIIQNRAWASHRLCQQMFLLPISRFCDL